MKNLHLIAASALSVMLTGCMSGGYSSKYGCSGLPDGVVCKSPGQIYELTNNDNFGGVYQSTLNEPVDDTEPQSNMFKSKTKAKKFANPQVNEALNIFSKPQFQSASSPMPVLEQPKVLRIWVAPWKDQNDTLNWGNFMFTEITPRRWNFGDSVMRNTPITAPNQADYMSPSEQHPTLDSTRDAAGQEAANIRNALDNQVNPQPVQPAPLSEGMKKQNQLAQEED